MAQEPDSGTKAEREAAPALARTATARRVVFALLVVLAANLSALVDTIFHPGISYFDPEHLVTGGITAVVVICLFIALEIFLTRQQRIDTVLQTSETRHRMILHAAMDGFWLSDTQGRLLEVNDAYCRMSGYGIEELLAMRISDLEAAELAESITNRLQEVVATGEGRYQSRHRRKDGRVFPVDINVQYRSDEGGRLVVFIQDISSRKQAEQAIKDRESLLTTTLASTVDGMLVVDNDGKTLLTNRQFADLWRIPESVLATGMDQVLLDYVLDQLIDPGAFRRGVELLYASDATAMDTLHFKDGRILERYSVPLVSGGIRIGRVWSFRDITGQRRAAETLQAAVREKEALLQEVHHRVKNNLQVITSLLRLESVRNTHPDTKAALMETQGRVRSMALLHETLCRSGTFAAVDLGTYLQRLSTEVFHALVASPGFVHLRLDLIAVHVEMDQAMPCGLLVNELLSNSIKHGFPDGRSGEVRVELLLVDDDRQLRLRVSDTGVGLPEDFASRRAESLGLQLVSDLAGQLGGTLEIAPGPAAVFTVTFPVHKRPVSADVT